MLKTQRFKSQERVYKIVRTILWNSCPVVYAFMTNLKRTASIRESLHAAEPFPHIWTEDGRCDTASILSSQESLESQIPIRTGAVHMCKLCWWPGVSSEADEAAGTPFRQRYKINPLIAS